MGNAMEPVRGETIDKFLKTLLADSGPNFALLAQIGFETGLRVSDLLKLKYSAFKRSKTAFQITEQKTNKKKRIKFSEPTRRAVESFRMQNGSKWDDYIFSVREGRPMSRTTAYRHIQRAGAKCGLKRVGPHSLRKTYAIGKYLETNGDLNATREAMNHKYSETTLYSYLLSGVDLIALIKK